MSSKNKNEKEITVKFHGENINGSNLEHIFSFTYYLPKGKTKNDFDKSTYKRGLTAYTDLMKNNKIGMIIYTDNYTVPFLQEAFPSNTYSNLTIAVVQWPYFSDEAGNVNNFVMRTLRFHAVEHFKDHNVHIRDADTLYAILMDESKKVTHQNKSLHFESIVQEWEEKYLDFIPHIEKQGKQIVFGSHHDYVAYDYHPNLPYPVEFTFPIRKRPQDMSKKNRNSFLYVKRNNNREIDYYFHFKKKYMFQPQAAIYAGFVSVLKNRKGIEDFWTICVSYMLQRYRMTTNEQGNRVVTNDLFKEIEKGKNRSFYAFGKDERMLIFGIVPQYIDKIYFFDVVYNVAMISSASTSFFKGEKFKNSSSLNNYHETLLEGFVDQTQDYKKYLEDFFTHYPTEKDFLNSVNANVDQRLIPYHQINSWNKQRNKAPLEPYKAYNAAGRKATKRVGGSSKRTLKKRK